MKRTALFLALFALTTFGVQAQHFDWAKGYYGIGDNYVNIPRGLVGDSEGNVYHLMQCGTEGLLDSILPFEAVTNRNISSLLVKMSPQGEYLWHRELNNWERGGMIYALPFSLRMVGDSALMMMALVELPHIEPYYNYVECSLYYLDTLLTTSESLMPTDSVESFWVTAFLTLGLDGTLKEQHFLQVSWLDSIGNPVTGWSNRLTTEPLGGETFDLDSHGNIYVVRRASDAVSRWCDTCEYGSHNMTFGNGELGAQRIVVDGNRFLAHTPEYPTGVWNYQMLKFSPHFDSLLDASYLIDSTPWVQDDMFEWIELTSFDIHDDQLYLTLTAQPEHDNMLIARSDSLRLEVDSLVQVFGTGSLLRLDTALNANLLMQFTFLPHPSGISSLVSLSATCIDTACGSLFVLGSASTEAFDGNTGQQKIVYRDDTLNLRNDAFWMRVGLDDGHFISYGRTQSSNGGTDGGMGIVAQDNRVFAQVGYARNINFADTSISVSSCGVALAQWDYDGHQVKLYPDYPEHPGITPGHILLHDTAIYITGISLRPQYEFETNPYGTGIYTARFVDTSLRSPYIYPDLHQDQVITWDQPLHVRYDEWLFPLTATASSGLPVVYTVSDSSVALVANNHQIIPLTLSGSCQITASQPGTSYWNAAVPVTRTLIIGNQPQHIIWDQPLDFTLSDSIITLHATTTEGYDNVYFSMLENNGVLEPVDDMTHFRILGEGNVEVIAYHPGVAYYFDACDTIRTLTVSGTGGQSDRLGVKDEELEAGEGRIVVYPNPTSGRVTVTSSETLVSATVIDMAGRGEEVRLNTVGSGQYSLDLTSHVQGAYFLSLTTADGRKHTLRLIKTEVND